jgi:putative aminopeptidase FrvX
MVYSHSPVETVSSRDVDALSQIITDLATGW